MATIDGTGGNDRISTKTTVPANRSRRTKTTS